MSTSTTTHDRAPAMISSPLNPSGSSEDAVRALGSLVAVNQLANGTIPVRLVDIEEPEAALHPAAAGVLMDAFRESAVHTQVVVTTHSPDLLDETDPDTNSLLVVQERDGDTEIGSLNHASRAAIKEHRDSPGDLLRLDQLAADEVNLQRQRPMTMPDDVEELASSRSFRSGCLLSRNPARSRNRLRRSSERPADGSD